VRFDLFLNKVEVLKGMPLPGDKAHSNLLPINAQQRNIALEKDANPRLSGVAAIFHANEVGDTALFLIERQTYKGVHSGQIAFPGGKYEEIDGSLEQTARRETFEEIGISPQQLVLINSLTKVYIPPSRFLVQPFMFALPKETSITKDPREVKSIIQLPISRLLDDQSLQYGKMEVANGVNMKTPYFASEHHKIWGATAMMLSEIKLMLRKISQE
jgi:8-oxo-dGTP pyrophosphatase MutT (NUDIX family)